MLPTLVWVELRPLDLQSDGAANWAIKANKANTCVVCVCVSVIGGGGGWGGQPKFLYFPKTCVPTTYVFMEK